MKERIDTKELSKKHRMIFSRKQLFHLSWFTFHELNDLDEQIAENCCYKAWIRLNHPTLDKQTQKNFDLFMSKLKQRRKEYAVLNSMLHEYHNLPYIYPKKK